MAYLVVDEAKCVAGMGRGAHRARTSVRALPTQLKKKQYKVFFPLHLACLVADDAKYVAGMGRGAHRARMSIWGLPSWL